MKDETKIKELETQLEQALAVLVFVENLRDLFNRIVRRRERRVRRLEELLKLERGITE